MKYNNSNKGFSLNITVVFCCREERIYLIPVQHVKRDLVWIITYTVRLVLRSVLRIPSLNIYSVLQ